MAEIKPIAIIASMRKKVCSHSDMYFRTNRQTGKTYTGKICNPGNAAPSGAQLDQMDAFKAQAAAVRAFMAANKAVPTERYLSILASYKAQHKIGSLFGYLMAKYNSYKPDIEG